MKTLIKMVKTAVTGLKQEMVLKTTRNIELENRVNEMLGLFLELQTIKVSLISQDELLSLRTYLLSLPTLEQTTKLNSTIDVRKKGYNNKNIQELDNVSDFYKTYNALLGVEKRFYTNSEVLEIIEIQKDLQDIAYLLAMPMLKKSAGTLVRKTDLNFDYNEAINMLTEKVIAKIFTFNNDTKFTTYIYNEITETISLILDGHIHIRKNTANYDVELVTYESNVEEKTETEDLISKIIKKVNSKYSEEKAKEIIEVLNEFLDDNKKVMNKNITKYLIPVLAEMGITSLSRL